MVLEWWEVHKLEAVIPFFILYLVLLLYLVIFPVKGKGIVNFSFGLIGIIIGVSSYALGSIPFAPYSNLLVGILSVLCMLVGDRQLL